MTEKDVSLAPSCSPKLEVKLLRNEVLGRGAYGEVCHCFLGNLACAGKVLHAALMQWNDPGEMHLLARFEEECKFISNLKHPNIVQYLGLHYDPESGAPVLLMELLDGNLTWFLGLQSQQLAPKMQIDLCIDISLALEFLHANDIIHQDLSSNNILLQLDSNRIPTRAKVTDFGVSKISDPNRVLTESQPCPGSLLYMPPEVLCESPQYSAKLDIFSLGVLIIQILTTKFPSPQSSLESESEAERRAEDMAPISTENPIRSLVIDCLHNKPHERPNAFRICSDLLLLKDSIFYKNDETKCSFRFTQPVTSAPSPSALEQRERENHYFMQGRISQLENQLSHQTELNNEYHAQCEHFAKQLQEMIEQTSELRKRNEDLSEHFLSAHSTIGKLRSDLENECEQRKLIESHHQTLTKGLENAIHDANDRIQTIYKEKTELLQSSECSSSIAGLRNLQQQSLQPYHESVGLTEVMSARKRSYTSTSPCLHFKQLTNAPDTITLGVSASSGDKTFFMDRSSNQIHGYDTVKEIWFNMPVCPVRKCGLAIIGELITIGGESDGHVRNELYTYSETHLWSRRLPAMPTKRCEPCVATNDTHLIVAGGSLAIWNLLSAVEIMDIDSLCWMSVASLPVPLSRASLCILEDQIHILGGKDINRKWQKHTFLCSFEKLLKSQLSSRNVWSSQLPELPVEQTTVISHSGYLLAFGGYSTLIKTTVADVYFYDRRQKNWMKLESQLSVPRSHPIIAHLMPQHLLILGGRGVSASVTQIAELGTIFP